MSKTCVCATLREMERKHYVSSYTYGRCPSCITRINEAVPRCFSCDMHPAPASGRACRGCIRRTRREFAKYETNYTDALVAHRAWTSNLNQDEYTHLALKEDLDGSTSLDSPKRKDYYSTYPSPITKWDVTQFLTDNPNFLWG
uniref:Uncharacterized protein n=1 Tax=viral metagenome TaxID=1070528 RepID=A0A6C0LSE0_9ZZZZ